MKRKQTKPNKRKSSRRTKNTNIRSLIPSEIIALLKGLKTQEQNNTRKYIKQIASLNKQQSNKDKDQHRLRLIIRVNHWGWWVGGGVDSLTHSCFVVYSAGRFVVYLSVRSFVLVFFGPFAVAVASLVAGEGGGGGVADGLGAFRAFVRFVLVWICRFPLPLWVWEGLRFVIVALPGLLSYLF